MPDPSPSVAKVFGIGFQKTGTTSLKVALRRLGCRVTGPDFVRETGLADRVEALARERLEHFDAVQDNPWPLLYRRLDAWFPGSRFVLTIRESEAWYESAVRHFGSASTPMRRWIYGAAHGCPLGNRDVWLERYNRHNAEVVEYFRDRPGSLLVLRVTEGEGWEKLCPFLGKRIRRRAFPHANAQRAEGTGDGRRRTPVRRGAVGAGQRDAPQEREDGPGGAVEPALSSRSHGPSRP